jgi:hypothetical protein
MGPGEFFVFTATLVGAALIALLMVTSAYKRRLDFKLRMAQLETAARVSMPSAADDRAEHLEERVRVLERIATDRGQDIAHQIESLRERQVEQRSEAK